MPNDLDLYADEEKPRLFSYPPGLQFSRVPRPHSVMPHIEQSLGVTNRDRERRNLVLPESAIGWVTAPMLVTLSPQNPEVDLGPALENLLRRIRSGLNAPTIENNLTDGLLRMKRQHISRLRRTRTCDPNHHMFPAQLGKRFGDTCVSPRRAEVLFDENEFGLDPVTALHIVVKHWKQLSCAVLRIDCPGAEYAPNGDPNKCTDTPRIDIAHGVIALDWNPNQCARGLHGSASGWAM